LTMTYDVVPEMISGVVVIRSSTRDSCGQTGDGASMYRTGPVCL